MKLKTQNDTAKVNRTQEHRTTKVGEKTFGAYLAVIVFLVLATGCSLSKLAQQGEVVRGERWCFTPDEDSGGPKKANVVHVTGLGWHTGILLHTSLLGSHLATLLPDLKAYDYLEFGWGDREFYMASGYSFWLGLKAMFLSAGSVMHVAGFSAEGAERFVEPISLVKLMLSDAQLQELQNGILASFKLDQDGKAQQLGAALYGNGYFYEANGDFSLTRSCNSWTSAQLEAIGCPIKETTRASRVLGQLVDGG